MTSTESKTFAECTQWPWWTSPASFYMTNSKAVHECTLQFKNETSPNFILYLCCKNFV